MTSAPPDYGRLVDESEDSVEASSVVHVLRIVVPLVLGALAGFVSSRVATALWVVPVAAAGGAALGYLAVVAGVQIRARQLATQQFFVLWAQQRGLAYDPDPPVYDDTPFLRAGDDQFAARSFSGTLAGRPGSVYQHTKRVKRTSVTGRAGRRRRTTTRTTSSCGSSSRYPASGAWSCTRARSEPGASSTGSSPS